MSTLRGKMCWIDCNWRDMHGRRTDFEPDFGVLQRVYKEDGHGVTVMANYESGEEFTITRYFDSAEEAAAVVLALEKAVGLTIASADNKPVGP